MGDRSEDDERLLGTARWRRTVTSFLGLLEVSVGVSPPFSQARVRAEAFFCRVKNTARWMAKNRLNHSLPRLTRHTHENRPESCIRPPSFLSRRRRRHGGPNDSVPSEPLPLTPTNPDRLSCLHPPSPYLGPQEWSVSTRGSMSPRGSSRWQPGIYRGRTAG